MRRFQKDRLDSVTGKLFGQQDLIGIFSAQAVLPANALIRRAALM
jgi:hypothetical protein